jgi:hypothetical protein
MPIHLRLACLFMKGVRIRAGEELILPIMQAPPRGTEQNGGTSGLRSCGRYGQDRWNLSPGLHMACDDADE